VSGPPDNVRPFSKPQPKSASNGGNGNGYGARLAVVETRLTADVLFMAFRMSSG